MVETGTHESDFLILRKTPYADTSLIVAGLSPSAGQLHFLVRGGRRIGRRGSPVADLFRILHVSYRPARGDLHTWRSAELVTDFSGVAGCLATYHAAGWLSRFTLANTHADHESPRFYHALCRVFHRLAGAASLPPAERSTLCRAALITAALVYLDEHGLLDPDACGTSDQRRHVQRLVAMAEEDGDIPLLTPAEWDRLAGRVEQWLVRRDCRVPAPIASTCAIVQSDADGTPGEGTP